MKGNRCCYGYARVSTQKQVQEGHSIDDQLKKIKAWCELHDLRLINIYIDEGVSGTFMFERPAFSNLMKEIDEGDILIAYDLSRVSRNSRDTAELIERLDKIKAHAVFIKDGFDTSTMMGKSMAQMASIMKSMEATYTSERVKDIMQSKKEKGQLIGRPPYGWKKASEVPGSGLVEVPFEQAVIAKIKELRSKSMTYPDIAKWLNDNRVIPPGRDATRKNKWKEEFIKVICNRGEVPTASKFSPM